LLKQIQELFAEAQVEFAEAQLRMVPRPFTLRCGPAVFHRSARRRCEGTAADRFIQVNGIPRLGCVRHLRSRTGGLFIPIEVRSRVPVHTRWQLSHNAIVSRHLRMAEIQLSHACGTSETPERSSVMETICGTQTIFEMETIVCVVTGKNTFSRSAQEIGIATGTDTVTIGGTVTDAASLTDRG
jgi:hypothetical protein